jgi:hypothetical protein
MARIWVWVDLDGPLDVKVSLVLYRMLEARNLAWDPTTPEGRQVRAQMAATPSCTVPLVLCTALLLVDLASSTATPCSIPAAAPALVGGSAPADPPIRSVTRGRAWWTLDVGRAGPGPEEFDRDLVALERAWDADPAASGPVLPGMRQAGLPAAGAAWDFSPALEGSTQSDRRGGGVGAAERCAVPRGLLGGVAASILRLRGAGARAEADRVRAGVLPETDTRAEKILLGPKRAMTADVYMDSEVSSEEEATVAGALPAQGAPNQMVQAHALFVTNLAESVTSDRLAALFQAVAPARPRPARAVSH